MSEIALVSARKSRLEADAKKTGSKTARTALKLANEPDKISFYHSNRDHSHRNSYRSLFWRIFCRKLCRNNRPNRAVSFILISHSQNYNRYDRHLSDFNHRGNLSPNESVWQQPNVLPASYPSRCILYRKLQAPFVILLTKKYSLSFKNY